MPISIKCDFTPYTDTKFTRIRSDNPRQAQNQKLCQFQKTLYSSAFADTTRPKSTQAISSKCDFTPYTDTNSNLKKNRNWPFMQVLADGVVLALMRIPDRAEVAHGLRQAAVGDGDDITNGYCDSLTSNSNRWSSEFFHNQASAPVIPFRIRSSRWSNASREWCISSNVTFPDQKATFLQIFEIWARPGSHDQKPYRTGPLWPIQLKIQGIFSESVTMPQWRGAPGPVLVEIYRKSLS